MLTGSAAEEVLTAVLRRGELVELLRDGPTDKRGLVSQSSRSRSTVNRGVRELEVLDVVTHEASGYALTTFGERVTDCVMATLTEIETARKLWPILEHVPPRTLGVDLELLADADVFVPTPGDPWAMVNRHIETLSCFDRCRAILPLTGLHAHERVYEQVTEEGAQVEIVASPAVAHTFRSDRLFRDMTREMTETGRFAVFESDEPFPYFLGIVDDRVQIGVDDDGEPKALTETTKPAVKEWAIGLFDRQRELATRVVLV
jgi:predicted transcriptional regulator